MSGHPKFRISGEENVLHWPTLGVGISLGVMLGILLVRWGFVT